MKKMVWNGVALLGVIVALSLAFFTGCPTDSGGDDNNTPGGGTTDALGLKSVTINGQTVDIGFKGTQGFAGSEGWGYHSNGAQNGGIYSVANAADLATVTVVATPQDSGATVKYASVAYTDRVANTTDGEYASPDDAAYSATGAFTNLSDGDYIAVEVSKGEAKAWYKFRVAVNAPLLGANGVSAGGTKLGWTIPEMFKVTDTFWTHLQGAYFHAEVGPNPDQSIGVILQDTLPLDGKTLSVDAPSGATAAWAIATAGDNNTGVTLPTTWNPISTALPASIASGSLLSVRVRNATKTLYYNWWVYKKPDIKLSALSIAGNAAETAKLVAFTDTWAGASQQEIIIPVDGDLLEGAKIAWTEPLGMGLAIAVTDGKEPAANDWQGTSRDQNDSYQVVVQPPAVDLRNSNILSIRARISDKVWYYKTKITFRGLQGADADLTGLSIGSGPTATQVTTFGKPATTVQAATPGQALNLSLAQATNAAITPTGGPNAEFLFAKGNGTETPVASSWLKSGTLSFDTGDYLLIQAFAGELESKYYKFPVTVTYPNANDVKLETLTIGGPIDSANFGAPWVTGGAEGTAGAVEISSGQNNAVITGTVPAAAVGSTIKYAKVASGGTEPAADDWKEGNAAQFTFADTGDELWIRVAAGTKTIKTYKIAITVKSWSEDDAVLDSLTINGDFNFMDFSYGYTVVVTDFGTPNATIGSVSAGSFSVEAGKGTGFGPGLYVNAVANSGATIEFAKTTGAEPETWTPGFNAQTGPLALEFATDDVLWARVTAGTFVKYYKFTVTVTPAQG